jgi:hypothetical protein
MGGAARREGGTDGDTAFARNEGGREEGRKGGRETQRSQLSDTAFACNVSC